MPYVTVSVRVPSKVSQIARDHAKLSGWQLADYMRTMLCLGLVFLVLSGLSEERRNAASTLLGGLTLLKLSRSFSLSFAERPYEFKAPGRKSTLVTLSLPVCIRDEVVSYANLMKVSPNETYNKCLQQGLLVYATSHRTLQGLQK